MARRIAWVVLAAVLAGCADGPRCVPVSGRVTLDGGPVPGPGFVYFNTAATGEGGASRPGTAEFDAEGNYRATTFAAGDGLLPGRYVIRVDCWQTPPNMEGKPVVSFLPTRYQDAARSGLELVVPADARPVRYDIELKSR